MIRRKLLWILTALILLISFLSLRIAKNYTVAIDEYAAIYIKKQLRNDINKIISDQMDIFNVQINEICRIDRSDEGKIVSIKVNTALLNAIIYETEFSILNNINYDNLNFGICMGSLLGSRLFSNFGPTIDISIKTLTTSKSLPKSELISSGINQTLHRISVDYTTIANCVAPFHEISIEISTTLVICETLIVGSVPEILLPTN